MQACYSVNWYPGSTDKTLENTSLGEILHLSIWTGERADLWCDIHVTSEAPLELTARHSTVGHAIPRNHETAEFLLVFGELVYNHAPFGFPIPNPEWQTYLIGCPSDMKPRSVAVAYRIEQDSSRPSVACVWWSDYEQDAEVFHHEVLAAMSESPTAVA